jgi:hypothetical protein
MLNHHDTDTVRDPFDNVNLSNCLAINTGTGTYYTGRSPPQGRYNQCWALIR